MVLEKPKSPPSQPEDGAPSASLLSLELRKWYALSVYVASRKEIPQCPGHPPEDVTFALPGDGPVMEPSTYDPGPGIQGSPSSNGEPTNWQGRCLAATGSAAGLTMNAAMNEGGAAATGEVTPVSWPFHTIAVIEGIAAGAFGLYALYACNQ